MASIPELQKIEAKLHKIHNIGEKFASLTTVKRDCYIRYCKKFHATVKTICHHFASLKQNS